MHNTILKTQANEKRLCQTLAIQQANFETLSKRHQVFRVFLNNEERACLSIMANERLTIKNQPFGNFLSNTSKLFAIIYDSPNLKDICQI